MVDLLRRTGKLKKKRAKELIENMPMSLDLSTWRALLRDYRKHHHIEKRERIGRKLSELQPD